MSRAGKEAKIERKNRGMEDSVGKIKPKTVVLAIEKELEESKRGA